MLCQRVDIDTFQLLPEIDSVSQPVIFFNANNPNNKGVSDGDDYGGYKVWDPEIIVGFE